MAAPDQRQPRAHNQKRRIWLFTHPASGTPLQRTLHEALLATAAGAGSLPGWGHWGTETPFTISHQSSLFGIDFGSKMRIPDRLYLLGGHTPKQSLHPNTAQDPCSSATAPNIQKHWTTMAGLCKPANLYSSASSPKREGPAPFLLFDNHTDIRCQILHGKITPWHLAGFGKDHLDFAAGTASSTRIVFKKSFWNFLGHIQPVCCYASNTFKSVITAHLLKILSSHGRQIHI